MYYGYKGSWVSLSYRVLATSLFGHLDKRVYILYLLPMKFEYDPAKSESNKAKHGIDFEEAQALWRDVERLEARIVRPGEKRYLLVGLIDALHWTAIITYRLGAVRIISVRRARHDEVERYEKDRNI